MSEILVSYSAIDTAIEAIDNEIKTMDSIQKKLSQTTVAREQKSQGLCAEEIKEGACTNLPNAVNEIIALMKETKEFLNAVKTGWNNADK